MTITKREVLVSIVIICIMAVFGVMVSESVNDLAMERQQEFNTALQIDNDKSLFEYGMRTNIGNAFVYGELKAVDPVTYDEIGGEYSYIEKAKERYTRHTRTVTKTRTVNGKTETYTDTEVYYSWDRIDSWSKQSEKVTFLDVEFDYGAIDFPRESHIATIKESSNIRYVYYGRPAYSTGTIYAQLADGAIHNASMYRDRTIQETLEYLLRDGTIFAFWVLWVILTAGVVVGFYYLDNEWLDD